MILLIRSTIGFVFIFCSFLAFAVENSFHLTIPMQQMSIGPTSIYSQPSPSSQILKDVEFKELVSVQDLIIQNGKPWWKLKLKTGDMGYIRSQDLVNIFSKDFPIGDAANSPYMLGITDTIELLLLNPEIEVDPKIITPYLNEAINANSPTAYWLRGITYRDGLGRDKNIDAAITDFLRASNTGETRAYYDLATIFSDKSSALYNNTEALRLYRSGAEQGDPRAKAWLADFNISSLTTKFDPSEILFNQMMEKAKADDTEAMRVLGALYLAGRGVDRDGVEAEKWLKKAALLGDDKAMLDLASLYFTGHRDVPPNSEQATNWYRLSAAQNNPKAQYLYGNSLYYGLGVKQDKKDGIEWIKKAAQNGYKQAFFALRDLKIDD
ncbi:MAG: tetratricopeptide repeat protein [Alphaproteobacteria bacterium]